MDTMPGDDPMEKPAPLSGLDPADLLRQGAAEDTFADGATAAFHPPAMQEIAAAFPQLEILGLIGQGGMGAVYKVRQKDLDRIVALKILPPAIGQSAESSNRFTREARALAKLNHPGIVTIHEFGQQDGLFFILMEFVDGVNLAQLMKTGRVSPREALAIVPQVCDALQYAHDQGIVHRDIKPENLLLDRRGRVKVADFGIAKVVAAASDPMASGEAHAPENQTLAGNIIGTPQYMAPEQIEHPSDVDHRADIYALGVVFYQMLTGELPGKDLQAPSKKVQIDVRLDEIVLRAMEKRPEMRYQTAHELRTVVDGFPGSVSHPPSLPLPAPKRGMMRRWWWVFLVMIPLGPIIGLATGAAWASLVPKKYETAATIEIRPQNVEGMPSPGWIGNEFEKLKSRRVLVDVADQLDLPANWQVNRDEAVGILKGMITVENIRGTDLMRVRVRHTNHEQAVDIANGVVSSYQRSFAGTVIVHEDPLMQRFPVSPNVRLILVFGALGGLLLFPLMAVLLILILHRAFPEKNPAAAGSDPEVASTRKEAVARDITAPDHRKSFFRSKRIKWILAVCLVTGVLWMALENPGRSYPASSLSPAFKAPVMGRIEFIYIHAESHGMGASYASYDVKMWGDTQWKPSDATSITLKDGKSLWVKSRVNAINPEAPIAMVTTSSDLSTWETKELKISEEAPEQHLVFANGLRVEIFWTPAPAPVNPERPAPVQMQVMQQASKWSDEMHPVTVDVGLSEKTSGMLTAQKLADYPWDDLPADRGEGDGVRVSVDGLACLKIENPKDSALTTRLLTIVAPPVKAKRYALMGEVRYENVEGAAYLEMWNEFPRGRFFSRTMDEPGSGPTGQITGTSDWRPFILPFDQMRVASPPNRIEVNLHLPGRGVVIVGPLRLCELVTEEVPENMMESRMHPVEVHATASSVMVSGEVRKAGPVSVETPASLLSVVAAAGGWSEKADLSRIRLRTPGESDVQIIDLSAILRGDAVNPLVPPGAIVEIREK